MRVCVLRGVGPLDDEFLSDVLRLDGHRVEVREFDSLAPEELDRYDAAFASVQSAQALGWLSDAGRSSPRLRRIVVSRFSKLLAPLRPRTDLRLLLEPCTPAQALALLSDVGPRPSMLPLDEKFDWRTHDAKMSRLGLKELQADVHLGSIAALAAQSLEVPIAFVALVDSERQRFVGQYGLPDDLRVAGGTPREWSFCQHVVTADAPLVVEDAVHAPTLGDSPLVRYGIVRSYAGVPIHSDGEVVGTVCALASGVRRFTPSEIATLELAARAAEARIAALRPAPPPLELSSRELISTLQTPGPPPLTPAPSTLVGSTIDDKYLVTAQLGEGGMARVYLARDRRLERMVAIKVLDARLEDEILIREARQIVSTRHPCIMQLFDWGRLPGGRPYLVLEHVRGETLRDRIRFLSRTRTWLPRATVLSMLRNLSGALETLHGAGLVHGDVKPGNVLVDDALGRVVLIDFGMAIGFAEKTANRVGGGTPGYSAPEQLDPKNPIAPSPTLDVYALGALAYALLTYTGPFARLAEGLRIEAQREGAFVAPSNVRPDLGTATDGVFERALAPSPAHRYTTVSALVDALDQALPEGGEPPRALSTQSMMAVLGAGTAIPRSRGAAVGVTRRGVREVIGSAAEEALFQALPAADRTQLEDALKSPSRLFPAAPLVTYLRTFARGDLARLQVMGERLIATLLPEYLTSFQIERAPNPLLRAFESLFHRFHAWGDFHFVRESTDRTRIELAMPRELAPEQCTSLLGGMIGGVRTMRREVRGEQIACVANGAPACAFVIQWSAT